MVRAKVERQGAEVRRDDREGPGRESEKVVTPGRYKQGVGAVVEDDGVPGAVEDAQVNAAGERTNETKRGD